jgi:hypothetical protein
VEENGIGLLGELRWIVGVLIALRIEDGERWWELPTVSRDGGGGPMSNGDQGREKLRGKTMCNSQGVY